MFFRRHVVGFPVHTAKVEPIPSGEVLINGMRGYDRVSTKLAGCFAEFGIQSCQFEFQRFVAAMKSIGLRGQESGETVVDSAGLLDGKGRIEPGRESELAMRMCFPGSVSMQASTLVTDVLLHESGGCV